MGSKRTGGMTAMGILNIVFGGLGSLGSLLMIVGGGLAAGAGVAMESEMGAEADGMGGMAAAAGGILMIIGLGGLVTSAMLAVAGIGVLTVKPWGRVLSIVCGSGMVLLNGLALVGGSMSLITLGTLFYGGLLVWLCFSQAWKRAFTGTSPAVGQLTGQVTAVTDAISDGDYREAA